MGLCASGQERPDEAKSKDAEINAKMQEKMMQDAKIFKLLMLGTGDSGKTTFVKQFTYLFGKGFSDEAKVDQFATLVVSNTIESMMGILKCADTMSRNGDASCVLQKENVPYREHLQQYTTVSKYLDHNISTMLLALWDDPAVKHTYEKYKKVMDIPEAAMYFFENIKRYADEKFVPTREDILSVRARTTGVSHIELKVEGMTMRFVDVGGQKNERKKWIQCFDDVTAVIYVVAVSDFDQVMYEDMKTNRIQDSMNQFQETINNKWFANTPIILFFNKQDVLENKLKTVSFSDHFPEFKESNTPGHVSEHFRGLFLGLNQNQARDVFCYDTCAKSDDNIDKVFRSIKEIVIKKTMAEATMILPDT